MTSTIVEQALTTFTSNETVQVFANPVINEDFADPYILKVGEVYYAYATNTPKADLPIWRSTDLVRWEEMGDGMGPLPQWAQRGYTWAPDLMAVEGGFVLYYTARHRESGQQVIGAAFSPSHEGPFIDASEEPLIAQHDLGGAIDAHAFVDADGSRYLYWKNDGNSQGLLTFLWVQRLSNDGLSLLGEPTALLCNDQAWEQHLIEAPFVHARGGKYYLFYSAAHYGDETYCVGYGVADSPFGPFEKAQGGPFVCSAGDVAGPGGQGIIADACGNTWMYYHAWSGDRVGYECGGARSLRLDPLWWSDARPLMLGTSSSGQPMPEAIPPLLPETLALAAV